MRIAILDCATWISPELERFDNIGTMISAWLSPCMMHHRLIRVAVGDGDAVPAQQDYDGFIVSGSELGVYDNPQWMMPMRALLLDIKKAQKPILGICFGHQLMADTYGGRAEKAAGWAAGIRQFTVEGERFHAHVLHGDQVTEAPPDSRITGSAEHCPIGALAYDFPAMSVQFHPEYPRHFVTGVIDLIQDELLSAGEGETARQSMKPENTVKPDLFAERIAAFFDQHSPAIASAS